MVGKLNFFAVSVESNKNCVGRQVQVEVPMSQLAKMKREWETATLEKKIIRVQKNEICKNVA